MRDGAKTLVEPHRLNRVYIWKGVQGALFIKSFAPGERVYNEKRITVEDHAGNKTEYRVWNPY